MAYENYGKSFKILAVLNETGRTGTANLLFKFKQHFPQEKMNRKMIADILHYLSQCRRVRKIYHKRTKRVFWGYTPQLYEVTPRGTYLLRKANII